jgi:hypothetical protein
LSVLKSQVTSNKASNTSSRFTCPRVQLTQ